MGESKRADLRQMETSAIGTQVTQVGQDLGRSPAQHRVSLRSEGYKRYMKPVYKSGSHEKKAFFKKTLTFLPRTEERWIT